MKHPYLGTLTVCLLASCATNQQQPATTVVLQKIAASGIDSKTYAKIRSGRVLDFADILVLVQHRIPDAAIVSYLKSTQAVYRLPDSQLGQLTDAGAGSTLVNYLGKSTGYYEADRRNQTGPSKWAKHPYFCDPDYWGPAPFPYAFPDEWYDPATVGMWF